MHVIGKEVSNNRFNLRVLQSGEEKHVALRALNEDNMDLVAAIEHLNTVLPLPSTVYGKEVHGWSALFFRPVYNVHVKDTISNATKGWVK